MGQRFRRIAVLSTLVASFAAGGVVAAVPAGAATGQTSPAAAADRRSVSFSTTLTRVAGGEAGAADVISCGGNVTYPYVSGGAVRADVQAGCSAPVDLIQVGVGLYSGSGVNIAERFWSEPNASYTTQFAVFGCPGLTASYYSRGSAVFTKAGYANSPLQLVGQSPTVGIFC